MNLRKREMWVCVYTL